MSLFRGPMTIKINGEFIKDVLNVSYDTEDRYLRIEALVDTNDFEQINKILLNNDWVKSASIVACGDRTRLQVIAKEAHCKITTLDTGTVLVAQIRVKAKRVMFEKLDNSY
jgi:hypothetical protein